MLDFRGEWPYARRLVVGLFLISYDGLKQLIANLYYGLCEFS